jgi:periplasmic divalent cation tolerance protein
MIYIFWTCQSREEAQRMVHGLLEKRLIACGSIIPKVHSIYWWKGKIEESQEVKVILKTGANHFDAVRRYIQSECSYDVSEIAQIDITKVNPQYLAWVEQETALDQSR